ncbi:MAG: TlpA disulfide reductase family protein [Thermodesulfobacteriota bacterium]
MKCFPRSEPGRAGRRIPRRPVTAAFLALLAAAGAAFAQDRPAGAPPARAGVEAAAPGFTVRSTLGETFDFEAEKAKSPFLLVFFSVFCEPCRRELAIVQRIREKHRDSGWRVAAVSLDGGPMKDAVEGFLRQEGHDFGGLMDELEGRESFKIADLYGVSEIPSTFVVERGGRIVFAAKGLVKEGEIEKAMPLLPKQ